MNLALALLTILSLWTAKARTIDESETGALLSFPTVFDGPLYNKSWDVAPAQFGYQEYGGVLKATLILPANESYHKECPQTTDEPMGPEPLGLNPYIHFIQDWFVSERDVTDYVLVIDRLDCYFVDKIAHAQQMGASGVVMCDWRDERLFTMWMPEGWRDSIHIPAILLDKEDCRILMAHIGVQNWDPENIADMRYPTPRTMNWTVATIEWGLPHPDDRVEYELWTSSNDYLGSRFKHNFNTTAIMLDEAGDTSFTPHMYILNGTHWDCDKTFNGTALLPCHKQCSNSGRYCAVDPEYDMSIGLNGMDVIQENLRSLCVWKYDKEKFHGDDIMWWDYAVLWDENCGVFTNTSSNFHASCSFAQMDTLKSNGVLSNYVTQCIEDSGGYGYTDGENTILNAELRLKDNSSIFAVPMIRVNEFLIHGNIDCELPITTATCEVLAAICAGFLPGTEPRVCDLTPAPTMAVCSEEDLDCMGTCFGTYQLDGCGQCLKVSSHQWNACIGCNGLINETYDCKGTCGGAYDINPCGYCKDSRHPEFLTFGVDCEGNCATELSWDECHNCLPESSTEWNNCVGCDGVAWSGKEVNECGRCILATDTNFDEYGRDCTDKCAVGVADTHYIDKCGVCLLPSDENWNACDVDIDNTESPGIIRRENELTMVIIIVCVVAFLIIVVAVIIIGALWKKQSTINARFDSLAATYVHMDEDPQHSNFPVSKHTRMETVPDEPTDQ